MINESASFTGRRTARLALVALALLLWAPLAGAQTLRFSNHRRVAIPDYATLRIGPFYSTMMFTQTAGYRYTRTSGTGTDFLFNNERGTIVENGGDIPLVSSLDFRNYLMVSDSMDVDMSLAVSYSHYPFGTQEDAFTVNWAEEGVFIDLDFDLLGLSTEFELTPFIKGTLHDQAYYKVEYVDTRGVADPYGGSRYGHFHNNLGLDLDWLMAEDKNLAMSAGREDNVPVGDNFKEQRLVAYAESVGYGQTFGPLVAIGINAAYGQNTYPSATNRPDSSSQSYSANTTVRLTEWSVGAASLGYSFGSVSGEGANQSGGSGDGVMTASAALQTRLSKTLSHEVALSRSQRAGFNSPFEIYDSFNYNLAWKGELSSANLYSTLSAVDPRLDTVSQYTDWNSGINISHPIYVDLPLVYTEHYGTYITLLLSSSYDVRDNGALQGTAVTEAEWEGRYVTWVSKIGTSFPLIWDPILFSTYVEHMVRTSDVPDLAYTRDSFEATLSYSHKF